MCDQVTSDHSRDCKILSSNSSRHHHHTHDYLGAGLGVRVGVALHLHGVEAGEGSGDSHLTWRTLLVAEQRTVVWRQ